ncbi:caspase family protein [Pinibacter soli]|uniref:Caspase family protein n=1 Tax=Pinibacter soli TaxID=3044211 RepID=A0ABT6RCM6_9BACT|nr:caspase family protein [Pinibacter soli]MDI3320329.1 caspase family protein [Pinibacter soli]
MRSCFLSCCFLLLCQFVFPQTQTQRNAKGNQYMFCVGINNYLANVNPATCQICKDRGIKNLNGCLNDVDTISKLFIKYYGFLPENVTILRDQEASRAAILETFNKLLTKCQKGDFIVFFYSGHGSYEYESANDNQLRTGKGYRNTILSADIAKPGVPDFNSAELNKIFSGFTDKGVVLTVITDCCHSATNTRGSTIFEADSAREVKPSLEPGKFISAGAATTRMLGQSNALTIGSCQDNEIASEAQVAPKIYYGAFTINFCRSVTEWSQAPIDVLLDRTVSKLRLMNKQQTPNIEAARRRRQNLIGSAPAQIKKAFYSLKCTDCSAKQLPVITAGFTDDILNDDILVDTKTKDSIKVTNVGFTETEVMVINQSNKWKATDLTALNFTILKKLTNPDPPLKVFLGNGLSQDVYDDVVAKAKTLYQQSNPGYQWMNPSFQNFPDAVLFYSNGWKLNRDGVMETFTFSSPDATTLNNLINAAKCRSAYLQLPPPAALVEQLRAKLSVEKNRNFKVVNTPAAADYMLAGHFTNNANNIVFGWEKTILSKDANKGNGLTAVTDFFAGGNTYPVDSLAERLRRLSVLANWLSMTSPPPDKSMIFPFHLAIKNINSKQKADDQTTGKSGTEDKLDIGIEKDAGATLATDKTTPLFIYVMSIDPKGNTYLLYPQPRTSILTYPNNILSDTSFYHLATVRHTTAGIYHYVFIALREPVTNRDIFTRRGVVKGDEPELSDNPLEALLNEEGPGQRGDIKSFDHWMLKRVDIITR